MRTLQQIQQLFPASTIESGLPKEAVAQSRQAHGANTLTPLPREPLWKKFIEKFDEPIIKILLAAALLSMVVDLFKLPTHGTTYGIVSLLLVVAGIGAAYALGKPHWVPSVMFVLAIGLSIFGLVIGHPLVEGLAVMIAVILATGVAF